MKKELKFCIFSLFIMYLTFLLSNYCAFGQENNVTITDIDGNIYKTLKIGNLFWMAENLKSTRYLNGDVIATTNPATLDIFDPDAPKYQWVYDGNESNVATYGRLYTWYAATDNRNICPTGWHVPTDAEWTSLINLFGEEATNGSGFKALPGGYRYYTGHFFAIGSQGYWWCSTEEYADSAWSRSISFENKKMGRDYLYKNLGLSVRCVRLVRPQGITSLCSVIPCVGGLKGKTPICLRQIISKKAKTT